MRKDYTTLISFFIPNEKKYHFIFPLYVLYKYKGKDELDVTLDDYLVYYIIEPILNKNIEYNFELIWNTSENKESLDICVRLNNDKFDFNIVLDNLNKNNMIEGLKLFKEEYGKMIEIFR